MKNRFISLHSNCVYAKGFKRSIICDLQFSDYDYIPNDMILLFEKMKSMTIEEITNSYPPEESARIEDYFHFLIEKGYVHYSDSILIHSFDLNSQEENRRNEKEILTNGIIEIGETTSIDLFQKTVDLLSALGVWAVQLILKEMKSFDEYMKFINQSSFRHVEIITTEHIYVGIRKYFDDRIFRVSLYECSHEEEFKVEAYKIHKHKESLNELSDICGRINRCKFHANIYFYKDYLKGNTCLFGKISIDESGIIKRCLFSEKGYGHVTKTNSILDIDNYFFEDSKIRKDDIEKCKDCEHRIMCLDCRLHIKDKANKYSAPLHCDYNPYLAKWESV